MKHSFLYIILFSYSVGALFAQASSQSISNIPQSVKENRWDLNKYMWSHTHTELNKDGKAIIDFNALDKWLQMGYDLDLSRDGKYIGYSVKLQNGYVYLDSLIVQSTTNSWQRSFSKVKPGFFSSDSKQYILLDKSNLLFVPTGGVEIRIIKNVASYKSSDESKNEWLAYQYKDEESEVVLQNLVTGEEKRFNNVSEYSFYNTARWFVCQGKNEKKELIVYDLKTHNEKIFQGVVNYLFDEKGSILVLQTEEKTSVSATKMLQYVKLNEGNSRTIWTSTDTAQKVSNYSLDKEGKQLVLLMKSLPVNVNGHEENSLWYWRNDMDKAILKMNNQLRNIDDGLSVQGPVSFTDNGNYIQFSLLHIAEELWPPQKDAVKMDVWSYQDTTLQSTQFYQLKDNKTYKAILSCETGTMIRLEGEFETLKKIKGDYAVIGKSGQERNGDRFWESGYYKDSNFLVSLKTGYMILLATKSQKDDIFFSPGGKYLVYFDGERGDNYFSYELSSGKLTNISSSVPVGQLALFNFILNSGEKSMESEIVGWKENDEAVFVYDDYDIWELDLSGKTMAKNITNGYGRRNSIELKFSISFHGANNLIYHPNDTLLLSSFNRRNKESGYYKKIIDKSGNPEMLSIGKYSNDSYRTKKAADNNIWVIERQTTKDSRNYFLTSNFKQFKRITNLQPHEKYNWLSAELHSFKRLDGTIGQGILFKPENFDSTKKYPVIVGFYQTFSNDLYNYPNAGYTDAPKTFDYPAFMVSQGYLVFTPDIYFTIGKWGPSTVNTIDGAAQYLKSLPFVDGEHLGACGHSNSGRFGNYLLTHSNMFAAVSVGSGTTNPISYALSLEPPQGNSKKEVSKLETFEAQGRQRSGTGLGNLWTNKQSWIDQTSVLSAEEVTSPVLLSYNKKDGVPFEQGIQMFTALRRLEKKAWLVQYDQGTHTLGSPRDLKDFTIRYTQFFDHYLKCAPAPQWMTQGIPARLKGIEARYELDAGGGCAMQGKTTCNICTAWNKQYTRTPAMFAKEIKDWALDKDIKTELDKKETNRHNGNLKNQPQRIKENNQKLKGTWKGERSLPKKDPAVKSPSRGKHK